MAAIHEGELVKQVDSPLRPGPPERAFVRTPAKTLTAAAAAASLAEVDKAIAERRATIEREDEAIASFKKRIAGPAPNRLKSLLTGATDDKNELVQKIHQAAQRRDQAIEELQELQTLRDPLDAQQRVFEYDTELRPVLRKAIAELSGHLAAAEHTLRAAKDVIEDGERLHGRGMARAMISSSRNRGELPSPDGRELPLLKVWRDLLVDAPPNVCKLRVWRDDCAAAGIDLKR